MKQRNAEIVSQQNHNIVMNSKNKKANYILYNFWLKDGSVFENDEIIVTAKFVRVCYKTQDGVTNICNIANMTDDINPMYSLIWYTIYPAWQVSVYNKTDNNIYIDQANSFFIMNGASVSYGTASISSSAVNTSGNSNTNSTQSTISQKNLVIPPKSSTVMNQIIIDNDILNSMYTPLYKYLFEQVNIKAKIDRNFSAACKILMPEGVVQMPQESPVNITNVICYFSDEEQNNKATVKQFYELKEIAGLKKIKKDIKKQYNANEVNLPMIMRANTTDHGKSIMQNYMK